MPAAYLSFLRRRVPLAAEDSNVSNFSLAERGKRHTSNDTRKHKAAWQPWRLRQGQGSSSKLQAAVHMQEAAVGAAHGHITERAHYGVPTAPVEEPLHAHQVLAAPVACAGQLLHGTINPENPGLQVCQPIFGFLGQPASKPKNSRCLTVEHTNPEPENGGQTTL
eukprot:SM000343S12834  [mRNA]  locus=s343:46677:47984:- [translate_table: standard]